METFNEVKDAMFANYPDVVNLKQMRKMLGNIGVSLAYRLLKEKKIKSKKIGREYKISKNSIIQYLQEDTYDIE